MLKLLKYFNRSMNIIGETWKSEEHRIIQTQKKINVINKVNR